ncbi:adhesin [Flammeovirga sp. MY04]|uniref:hypothetical protein n=1 Tax=Flammeovirga sp. MY04 TaxID=1191459 RepID=UPI0008063BB0|nr:hypothetical protein [Flammeovirga sp. MY04]ANQ52261.1 adhesin [Flammeovirga sp. MY04]
MALLDRNTLKTFFNQGKLPSQENFHDLIESSVNKLDDGLSKSMDEGLMLSPVGDTNKLVSFFKNIEDRSPIWSFTSGQTDRNLHLQNQQGESVMTFGQEGLVGVNCPKPNHDLEVGGTIGAKARVGTLYKGSVEANGKWQPIIENLNGCHAFEIVAGVGKKKTGKYALVIAQAISTFGNSHDTIKTTQAYYGSRGNKIEFRWKGDTYNYQLEMRTKGNYEGNTIANFHVTSLWEDQFMDESFID